ncbi:13547_t:CDS:2 [Gigaspora margarita]|uniref:13547_t:CDS:1 n=1 Tax=Gigaspora margarita TaxID=4874 RepID=A0ABM8W006_GIGMA|nr:13547_t:CDS:2 [Gigaspora margarita]
MRARELDIPEKQNEINREFDRKYNYKGSISEIRGYGERPFDVNRDGINMYNECIEVQPKTIIDERTPRTPEERKWVEEQLPTCVDEPEIFYKEVEEEGEYADSHFSEIKRGIIDIIKQNPQEWEIKEENVSHVELEGLPKSDNFQDLSWEELTKEIEIQKAEIEKIKNNKDISNSERQIELQKREEKLKKLEKIRSNTTQKPKPNNNFPTG